MDETLRLGSPSEAWNQILQGPEAEVVIRENSLEEKVLQVREVGFSRWRTGTLERNSKRRLQSHLKVQK